MDHPYPKQGPALACLRHDAVHMRRRHRRIMFQFERDQPAIPPDDAGEAGHAAAAAGLQRGEFGCRIEILRLDGDAAHPPVTGGKIASSRASPMGLSSGTKRWSSAARSLSGWPKASA